MYKVAFHGTLLLLSSAEITLARGEPGEVELTSYERNRPQFHSTAGKNDWGMGPFVKRKQPILRPTPDSRFRCPIRDKDVLWEAQNVYHPAAVVRNGKVYSLTVTAQIALCLPSVEVKVITARAGNVCGKPAWTMILPPSG